MPDLRTLAADLAPGAGSPLLPTRRTGWLPHALVALFAVMMAGVSWHTLIEDFGVPNQMAAALGIAHAAALPLALYWPMSGWWLSLGLLVVSALAADPEGGGGPLWPGPGSAIHLVVLGLVGLRVPARVMDEMWVLTVLAGIVLLPVLPGRDGLAGIAAMSLFSGVVLIAVGALRGRAEALRQLREQQQAGALLEERTRIARELHDVVAHHLSVIAIQAEAGQHRPSADMPQAFRLIRQNATDAMAELHRVLELLREAGDAEHAPQPSLGLLDDLLAGVKGAGLDAWLLIEGDRRKLPEGVELSAYRIVQEALSNVLRHAPGARVKVRIAYRPDRLLLDIANGPSPAPASSTRRGHGLVGMRERAAMLGGELTAGPEPDGGYAVRACLPIKEGTGA